MMAHLDIQSVIEFVESVSTKQNLVIYALPGFVTVFLLYGTHKYVTDKLFYRVPPGPFPLPLIGSLWYVAWKSRAGGFVKGMQQVAQKYGPVFTCYLGPHRLVVIDDAKLIHESMEHEQGRIFVDRYEPQRWPGFDVMGNGVAFSSGDVWRAHRRFCLRAMRDFGMGKDVMVVKIHEEVIPLLDDLAATQGKPFNPKRRIVNAISNIICSFIFGKRYESPNDPEFKLLMSILDKGFDGNLVETGAMIMFPFLSKILPKPKFAKIYAATAVKLEPIMQEALADHMPSFNPEHMRDFVDQFIQAKRQGEGLDVAEYVSTMADLFAAGSETTATALTWTLLYLTKYPDIQRKCHEAIDGVIESDRLPTLADRPSLIYIDAVMHEILRHVSIAPLPISHCNDETAAQIGGYDIPPWTMVLYNIDSVHRDPKYWPNPEKFDPERWIDKDGKLLTHSSHFMPFGLGPRVCLGEALARVEYFIFLVAMLHRFEFKLATPNVSLNDGTPGIVHICPSYELTATGRH